MTFGEGSSRNGAAAYTSAIHVNYEGSKALKADGGYAMEDAEAAAAFAEKYQLTLFTINEYFNMGYAGNMIYDNGANAVNIALEDDAVWDTVRSVRQKQTACGMRVVQPER